MNATEKARRHNLRSRGIGSSREAVEAKRLIHARLAQEAIKSGARLPGWMNDPNLATPENVAGFLDRLDPTARANAERLMSARDQSRQKRTS
ncbi:MAG: hypothetical protein HY381_02035 [Candidatus Chisholmbacteria bacterium]|nr:hypothetical protein [Candidatus Chisholmbacteria bacterium]